MTVFEFAKIANEYARGNALNNDEKNIILDFARYIISKYQDELFEKTDMLGAIDIFLNGVQFAKVEDIRDGDVFPPIEKEASIGDNVASRIKEKDSVYTQKIMVYIPKNTAEANAYADSYIEKMRRFNHNVSDAKMKIVEGYIHDLAKHLCYCPAQTRNEIQSFVNAYFDTFVKDNYTDEIESSIYMMFLSDFAQYALL